MEVAAKLKGAQISAQKVRLVADQVRGMPVEEALSLLDVNTLDHVIVGENTCSFAERGLM